MKSYTFYLEFGEEKLTEEVELDDLMPPWKVQKVYQGWRDAHLVCGWWKKQSDHVASKLLLKLSEEKRKATNG